jgi:hypothetical protein
MQSQSNVTFWVIDISIPLIPVIVKLFFIPKATRHWSLRKWFYFNHYEIINSSTITQRAKKQQNYWSAALIIALFMSIVSIFLYSSLS